MQVLHCCIAYQARHGDKGKVERVFWKFVYVAAGGRYFDTVNSNHSLFFP